MFANDDCKMRMGEGMVGGECASTDHDFGRDVNYGVDGAERLRFLKNSLA